MPRGRKAATKAVTLDGNLNQKIWDWSKLAEYLKKAKEDEMKWRTEIVCNAGFDVNKLEGTENVDLGQGYILKAKKDQSYNLTNEKSETQELLGWIGAVRPDFMQNLVRWKPELNMEVYREFVKWLDGQDKADANIAAIREKLAYALTIKPGAPTLELVPPKAE